MNKSGIRGLKRHALSWGATERERQLTLPCDAQVNAPDETGWRAVDVRAPASIVFRWLCQLRAAPYSYDWLDNWGRRSPRELTSGLDALAVGQRVMTIFSVVAFERDAHLTIALTRPARATRLRRDRGELCGAPGVRRRVTIAREGRDPLSAAWDLEMDALSPRLGRSGDDAQAAADAEGAR